MEYFEIFTHVVVVMSLGWYMITNLQWYNYKIQRVLLKHHKQLPFITAKEFLNSLDLQSK